MKIVHICISSPWGEVYAYQENLLPHYHRLMGHEVTIIAPVFSRIGDFCNNVEPVGQSYLSDGTKVIRLAPLINNKIILAHMALYKGFKESIISESPDLIFAHDVGCFNYSCLPSIKKKNPNLRIVFDNHGDFVNSLHSPLTRILHKIIYRYTIVSKLLSITEIFYGVTPSRCNFLHDVYDIPLSKIKLLVMGADDEKMEIDKREKIRVEVREKYGIESKDFLIVTGGKIDRQKNIHVLAHAVNAINKANVKLLIFGNIQEDLQSLFKDEASKQLIMIGWVNSEKVYELFYAADFVMFPGLHSVLWEQAVASKVPCAFSKIDGFDHVNVNENCILMTGNDAMYYENLIKSLVNNPNEYNKLLSNSKSPLLNMFYYSNIAQRVFDDLKWV